MKNTKQYRWHLAMGGIGLAATLLAGCSSLPAPTEQVAVSKAAVANAARSGGHEFAPTEMRTAQEKLDSAEKAITARDYQRAQWMAEQAEIDAQLAVAKAAAGRSQRTAAATQEDARVLREELNRKR